jgi:hypothetical protein
MRSLLVLVLLAWRVAAGQDASGAGAGRCPVTVGPPEPDEQGRLVRPAPTADQCLFVADLMGQVLESGRALRRVTNDTRIPAPVRAHLGPMSEYGVPLNRNVLDPNSGSPRQHVTTWLSPELIVVLYRTQDFSGTVTSLFVADLATGTACDFPRWPGSGDPRTIAIDDIREILGDIQSGRRTTPTCSLRQLALE